MPDMTSGGNAGMAGVGRRAFAAAAWGVRVGVALAQGVAQAQQQRQQHQQEQTFHDEQNGRRPSHETGANTAYPQAQALHARVPSPAPSDTSSAFPCPSYHGQRSNSPSQREPPLLPKVSLKDRPRMNGPSRSNSYETEEDDNLKRKPSDTKQFFDRYKAMVKASSSAETSPIMGQSATVGGGAARTSSDMRDMRLGAPIRKGPYNRQAEEEEDLPSALPWAIPADDAPDLGRLALSDRVKIPGVGARSTEQAHAGAGAGVGQLGRHKTGQSSSSNSSGTSGRSGRSAPEQEVVTPSQSWEGFSDRRAEYKAEPASYSGKAGTGVGLGFGLGLDERERMEQIREDDEERDQVVFGGRLGVSQGLKPSTSDSSLSTDTSGNHNSNPYRAHSRAQTAPEHHAAPLSTNGHGLSRTPSANHAAAHAHANLQSPPSDYGRDRGREGDRSYASSSRTHAALGASTTSTSTSSASTTRRQKVCAKCAEPVGGAKRFVERDGVVLCERDWKKMYLPSCRKCRLPIEKSAVSSSDGQLKGKWHRACFTCTRCDKGFETDDFYVLDGRPWCQYHYHEEK